ncbi:unnamed protein product [Adineta ricciae]|uniref:Uncharacterized protein n=1 Tax=Adineta ricciae TaxID=249248 RepID=A0A814CPN0_ADIRI|nr:unnamed protein product [Adineta ricciae]CAF0961423.1 unnamed protein product [Adineta ricciae]
MEIRSDLFKVPCYARSHQGVCIEPFDCSSAIISKSSNALFPESIIEPPFCGLNIVQRLHHKVDLYQTPSTNETNRVLEQLTKIIKQHVPNFSFNENFGHDLEEYSTLDDQQGDASFLQNPSHLRKAMGRKRSKNSTYSLELSSARSLRSNKGVKQSLSRLNSESSEDQSSWSLSMSHLDKHHLDNDQLISATDLKRNPSRDSSNDKINKLTERLSTVHHNSPNTSELDSIKETFQTQHPRSVAELVEIDVCSIILGNN